MLAGAADAPGPIILYAAAGRTRFDAAPRRQPATNRTASFVKSNRRIRHDRTTRTALLRAVLLGASALTMTTIAAVPAAAQTSPRRSVARFATPRAPAAIGCVIKARNEGTDQVVTTTSGADGHYTFAGLRPAPYTISTTIGETESSERVSVEIGQSATLDLARRARGGTDRASRGERRQCDRRHRPAPGGNPHQRSRDQRQPAADPSLPQTDRNFLCL